MNHLTRKRFIRFFAIKTWKVCSKLPRSKVKLFEDIKSLKKGRERCQKMRPTRILTFDERPDAPTTDWKEEHQLPEHRSFKEKATEGHQNINRVWIDFLFEYESTLNLSTVPSSTRGLEQEEKPKVPYREKWVIASRLDFIRKEEALLVSVEEQEDTIENVWRSTMAPLWETSSQANKGYGVQPLNANKNQMLKSCKNLLEGLPETKVERRKRRKPLTENKDDEKSLSMIMKSARPSLPYVHPKTVEKEKNG